MIGRRKLPEEFREWNQRWRAPHGGALCHVVNRNRPRLLAPRLFGAFAFQPGNSDTRTFEYPWAYFATPLSPGMHVLDLGGSLAGFQFALASAGANVVNVDPGERAAMGWQVTPARHSRLNRAFGTSVELRNCFLEQAGIPSGSVDRVFSISTIEHIPKSSLPSIMGEIYRVLAPGGRCILTVDLFLDLEPFSDRVENLVGTNVDIRWLVESSGLDLVVGDPSELYGYPTFDPRAVLANLYEYFYGASYPALAQALVLEKPHEIGA
jgi:SAM-dependent methyltransferase